VYVGCILCGCLCYFAQFRPLAKEEAQLNCRLLVGQTDVKDDDLRGCVLLQCRWFAPSIRSNNTTCKGKFPWGNCQNSIDETKQKGDVRRIRVDAGRVPRSIYSALNGFLSFSDVRRTNSLLQLQRQFSEPQPGIC
jgi:hypothetical protein